MKIKDYCILWMMLLSIPVFAQESKLSEERRNEFEAQKVAFFTQQLDLTPAEAAIFWPLYNEMNRKIQNKEQERRKAYGQTIKNENITEGQIKKAVEKGLAGEQEMLDIKKEYYHKMMEVIPAGKINRIILAEHKFHRKLLGKLKKDSAPAGK